MLHSSGKTVFHRRARERELVVGFKAFFTARVVSAAGF